MQGYKTLLFNSIAAVLTVIIGFNWSEVLTAVPWLPPIIIAGANFALRFVTTTPVGTSQPTS